MVSTNNVLFNGNEYLKKGILDFKSNYNENFWEILPIEPIELSNKIISVSGLENKDFLIAEEKAAKAIQKHSMLINEIQYNPKINDSKRYTIPSWRIGASNSEVNTVAHEYIPINIDVLLYDSWVGNIGKFASL